MLSRSVGQSSKEYCQKPTKSPAEPVLIPQNRKSEFFLGVFCLTDEKSKNRLKMELEVSLLEF